MVFVHDMLSHSALQMYEVSLKIRNRYQVIERTRNSTAHDQREITPKISKAELWFLCMTRCLIGLYKCMKFQPNIFNIVQLTEQTRNCIYL